MNDGTAAVRKRKLLRGPRRKDDEMSWQGVEETALHVVELCEILPVDHETALLRVAARWGGPPPVEVAVRFGDAGLAPAVAPGPSCAADGLWSAGFEIPAASAGGELVLMTQSAAWLLPLPTPLAGGPAGQSTKPDPEVPLEEQLRLRRELAERELEELRGKLIQAWGEVAQARLTLDGREAEYDAAQQQEREALAMVAEIRKQAARTEGELNACVRQLETECDRLRNELAGREETTATAAALREQVEAARARIEQLDTQLTEARTVAHDAMDVAARAARELVLERAKVEETTELSGYQGERLAISERELGEARTELAAAGERTTQLEAELAAALERLDQEKTERRRAQDEADTHIAQIRRLEASLGSDDGEEVVEEDLRHLLSARQRELTETRAELEAQRARYAEVASKMTPTELAEATQTPPSENDWSVLDGELLDRLTRAKELSQED
jgi:chromosome segregation ATPase